MVEHPTPDECPNHFRVLNLEKWQKDQNGSIGRVEKKLDDLGVKVQDLCTDSAYRMGGEHMLKWIIGLSGVSGVAAVVGIILQVR